MFFIRRATRRSRAEWVKRIVLGLFVVGALGCQSMSLGTSKSGQSISDAPRGATLQEIIARGRLRVGLTGKQPPLNMTNKDGEIVGLEVDLTSALADAMGLEVEYVSMPFAELLDALESRKVDLVASGMTITPERNARVAFVGPYFITGKSVLAKAEAYEELDNLELLDTSSRRFAALDGSTSAAFVSQVLPNATLIATRSYDEAIQMVIRDEVDAMIADYQICAISVWRHPEIDLRARMSPFTIEPLGIALPADAPLFVNLVDNYLATLSYTGLLAQFKARWLNDGAWVDELP